MKKTKTTARPKVKTKTKAKATVKAKAKPHKTGKEIRPGTKLEIIAGLLQREHGCTAKEALAALGWPAISFPQQAAAAGLRLRREKQGRVTRYWGQP